MGTIAQSKYFFIQTTLRRLIGAPVSYIALVFTSFKQHSTRILSQSDGQSRVPGSEWHYSNPLVSGTVGLGFLPSFLSTFLAWLLEFASMVCLTVMIGIYI